MFKFDGKLTFLAPLSGYSDSAFRGICRKLGADVVTTEMVNAIGLTSKGSLKTKKRYSHFHPGEKPIGIQLFGNDPGIMADAAAIGQELGFDFVDINMGCPVKKVLKTGSGAILLRNKNLASSIVRRVKRSITLPLSVKIRTGWDEKDLSYLHLATALAENGADAIVIHPRCVKQGLEGAADHEKIAEICKILSATYIIANGDIETFYDAKRVYTRSGCNGIMIGREALRNPSIFSLIKRYANGERGNGFPSLGDIVLEHFIGFHSLYGEKATTFFKKHISWYSRDLPNSSTFREKVSKITNPEVMKLEIENFFEKNR